MKFKLDNEKRNLLRQAITRNHGPAILLRQHINVIQQVKLELAFLQVRGKIPDESFKELIAKYDRQMETLYNKFPWKALEKEIKGPSNKPCKQPSI